MSILKCKLTQNYLVNFCSIFHYHSGNLQNQSLPNFPSLSPTLAWKMELDPEASGICNVRGKRRVIFQVPTSAKGKKMQD